jgi:hemolysin activation/secretion protein
MRRTILAAIAATSGLIGQFSQPGIALPKTVEQITVQNFAFQGNTAFTSAELETVIQRWRGHPIGFNDLLDVREAITAHYLKAGYVTSFALIPEADNQQINVDTATIVIQIVEGKISAVQVENAPRLAAQIQGKLRTHAVFNQAELLRQLQFLRLDPSIRRLQAELLPGNEPGSNQLRLDVIPAPPLTIAATFNNQRSIDTGKLERNLDFSWNNPLGFGDRLIGNFSQTKGGRSWGASYAIPLDITGKTKISADFRRVNDRIVREPFAAIDIRTKSTALDLNLDQTVHQKLQGETLQIGKLGATLSWMNRQFSILDRPFPLTSESDDAGQVKCAALRLIQTYQQRGVRSAFGLRSQFNFGLPWNSTTGANGVNNTFFSWQGQATLNRATDWGNLTLRGIAQLSGDRLPSYEKLGLGGATTVHGYQSDAALGNSGLMLASEFSIPLQSRDSGLFVIPLLDFGMSWDQAATTQSIGSAGLGLEWLTKGGITARINYAIPFIHNTGKSSWQGNQLDFSVRYSYSF